MKIVFLSDRDGVLQAYSMDADGTQVAQITFDDGDVKAVACSPDGTSIATTGDQRGVRIMKVDTGSQSVLFNDVEVYDDPIWSRDGGRIAFAPTISGHWELWTANTDGSGVHQVTATPHVRERTLSWSPDGSQITFTSDRNGNPDIYVMNADGAQIQRLTNDPAGDWNACWLALAPSATPRP